MKIWHVILSLLAVCCQHLAYGDDAIDEVFRWLIANGAKVHEGLHGTFFQHGDASVRGVVASSEVSKNASVMVIPRRLWLEPGSYPEFVNAQLPSSCDVGGSYWEKELKFSAAIASEAHKGTSSFYYSYLKNLPTMADFESFVPWTMNQEIQSDFAALSLAREAHVTQAHFQTMHRCFDSWTQASGSPAKTVTWENTLLAMFWLRTRSYTVWGGEESNNVLIPGVDMVNTVEGSDLNIDYKTGTQGFIMTTYNHPISSGVELVENYCSNCTNEQMVWLWGIYLESNPFTINTEPDKCTGKPGLHMKDATLAALADVSTMTVASQRSPRCLKSTLQMAQGPLRCSMARIAWETCASVWDLDSAHAVASPSSGSKGKNAKAWEGSDSDAGYEASLLSKQYRVLRLSKHKFLGHRL